MKVAIFVPCYVDQVVPNVAVATVRLLERLGHQVVFPAEQTCCGQPAFNTGYWPEAAELAKRQIRLFLDAAVDAVVCPSGSCTAMQMVFYPTLLAGSGCEKDAAAFLMEPIALMKRRGMRWPLTGKFSAARAVWAP